MRWPMQPCPTAAAAIFGCAKMCTADAICIASRPPKTIRKIKYKRKLLLFVCSAQRTRQKTKRKKKSNALFRDQFRHVLSFLIYFEFFFVTNSYTNCIRILINKISRVQFIIIFKIVIEQTIKSELKIHHGIKSRKPRWKHQTERIMQISEPSTKTRMKNKM